VKKQILISAGAIIAVGLLCGPEAMEAGQQPDTPAPKAPTKQGLPAQNTQKQDAAAAHAGTPLRIRLQDALALARKNEPTYHSAITESGLAQEDRIQARDALLPSVNFDTSVLYTQPNSFGGVRYIANNAPREYISQGNIHQQLDLASVAAYRRSAALAAVAKARTEIASRGLVVTVVQNYFGVAAAEQKLATARQTAEEGDKFFALTKDLEKAGEVAHSDVIKAELQMQDRHRQFMEAQLVVLHARLALSVLLFPDFNDNFELADDLHANVPLPPRDEFEAQVAHESPEIRAALGSVQAAGHDVAAARAEYFPSVALDYWYGIDAEHYATYTPLPPPEVGRTQNLGSSALASMSLPIWNWGATESRVRQAELRRDQTKMELSYTQRKLLADMRALYAEAETALDELAGLQRSSELAADSLRLTTLRYKDGEATVLEVVDAQTTFGAANANYQDGALRYRVALANLQTLTGVLIIP
jgi:outer membrane protein TolC